MRRSFIGAALIACQLYLTGCGQTEPPIQATTAARSDNDATFAPQTYAIAPSKNVQFELQARIIDAVPGDVIQLEAGRYELQRQLDVAADNVTIRGRGPDKTILTFKGQTAGGQGIEATGNNFTLEGLAVEDTAGNAVKVLGARNVTIRDVRVEWTGEQTSANGAYGLYPVQCQNVLLEKCTAIGASDAGLYVGQCHGVIVRNCRAERNVAGIEIENTVSADVFDNLATNNAGGLLVFNMPGLQLKAGKGVRVFRNKVVANNHPNFADPGAIVAAVPSGTGVMVMATDHVEVFDNQIEDNQTASVLIVSYLAIDRKINDPSFDAIPEHISIHNNRIAGSGQNPQGVLAELLKAALGEKFPDIMWDGVFDPTKDGPAKGKPTIHLADNGAVTFVNFNLPQLTPENIQAGAYKPDADASLLNAAIDPLPEVKLTPHDPPTAGTSAAVRVYRSLPKKLSEFGLFEGPLAEHRPAAGVVLYDLNTPLFSDYADKRRFIKLPPGKQIEYREQGLLAFPVGTIISKTFSYPHDASDPSKGEQILETRIELFNEDGWYGVTYVWNDEQTEAELALGGSEVDVSWKMADGKEQHVDYVIPNANQCLNCHSQDKKFLPIGPTARNLNRPAPTDAADEADENQLAMLAHAGMLANLPDVEKIAAFPRFDDPHSAPADKRARAWLDVNCAHCHNPAGTARTSGLDLSWDQADPAKLGVWKAPVAAGHGSGGRKYDVIPGKPDESILLFRIESEDPSIMMPNVGRRLIPAEAVALVQEWIEKMPPTE